MTARLIWRCLACCLSSSVRYLIGRGILSENHNDELCGEMLDDVTNSRAFYLDGYSKLEVSVSQAAIPMVAAEYIDMYQLVSRPSRKIGG